MKDYFLVRNKNGSIVADGYGQPPQMQSGWVLSSHYSSDEIDSEPDMKLRHARDEAENTLIKIDAIDRTQALIAKAAEAKAFCQAYPEPFDPSMNAEPDVIDQAVYPMLYEEYWLTFDLVQWSPHQLAQAICDKAAAVNSEGDLRREKLLAEKAFAENQ